MRKIWNEFVFLKQDLCRYIGQIQNKRGMIYLLFECGVWTVIIYRISRIFFLFDIPILKLICRFVSFILFKINEFLGVAIPPSCEIEGGLYIGHTGVIRFYHTVRAGKNLSIGQLVTVGTKGLGVQGAPVIGDNVYIGVGAKVLGPIKIGNNVHIGANAVVLKDVPDDCTAVGVPARIVDRRQ